jgi:flagella basal body P-ring formation protein FlgA
MRLAMLLAALLATLPAARAETLRAGRTLHDSVVRLSDLFDGLGRAKDAVLGPAPVPGRSLVLEAPQLAAIARRYGLLWRPAGVADRVLLERPGRPVAREEVLDLLREELGRLGLDPEADLELADFAPPMVPVASLPHLALERPDLDAASGRFAATLAVTAGEMPALRLRLSGRAVPMVPVVVAARRLGMGEVLRAEDLRLARIRAERRRPGMAQHPAEIIGQRLRRPAGAGQPLSLADLGPAPAVERHAPVTMVLEVPGLRLTMRGRALEAAPQGGRLPVMNLASRLVVEAEAIGPGLVRVILGGAPIGAMPPGAATLAAMR